MNVYFLHGFLGLPSDWVTTLDDMQKDPKFDAHVHLMNIWRTIDGAQVETMFTDWATEFSKELKGDDNWLVGYSLGGRLLLNLPEASWPKVKGLILISSHPGLSFDDEKAGRLLNDQNWSKKFKDEEWSKLMTEWEQQEVFGQDQGRPERFEDNYQRDFLSKAIDGWSLGRQKDFLTEVDKFPFPVHYIYGEKDNKYAEIAKSVSALTGETAVELPGGHSPLFSCPENLSRALRFILLD